MASAIIDGIATRYEVIGSGPPLLMYAPGGFDATIEKWSTQGIYAKIKLLDHLPKKYTCIVFDRRECGQSGGRVERVTWAHYVAQGKGLLDHLGIERAHIMGGCMGCCPVAAFAVAHPEHGLEHDPVLAGRRRQIPHHRATSALPSISPSCTSDGLDGVVALVAKDGKPFGADPRGGPWASVIKRDRAFAAAYAKQERRALQARSCAGMGRTLFDRDTAPGAEPEDLMRLDIPALIVPGHDASHATSAARYLEECLPRSEYWDVPVGQQTEAQTNARILEFLENTEASFRA